MPWVFAYGSLMSPASQATTLGAPVRHSMPATIAATWGYRVSYNVRGHDGESYLGLARGAAGPVQGVLLWVPSARDMAKLEARERYYRVARVPCSYVRPCVRGPVVAFVPLAPSSAPLRPTPRYATLVRDGVRARRGSLSTSRG